MTAPAISFLIFFAFFAAPREIFSRKVAKNAKEEKEIPDFFSNA